MDDARVAQEIVTCEITLTDLAGNSFVRDSTTDGTTVTIGAHSNARRVFAFEGVFSYLIVTLLDASLLCGV